MSAASRVRFFIPLLGAAVLLMTASCYTPKALYNFDESLAPEQTTSIVFAPSYFIWKSYNGISVHWNDDRKHISQVFFPSGKTELVFDLRYASGTPSVGVTRVNGDNLVLNYNFKAQKKYWIWYPGDGLDVRLYELEPDEKITQAVYSRHEPIKIQVASDRPTVLD